MKQLVRMGDLGRMTVVLTFEQIAGGFREATLR